ncbi:MAG: molybdopterin-dependent oxidoreductase [Sulfurovum sp.]|nr:molybdopterin-dependent oxidoreductase [Sulfurovum sp.]MCB4762768.1 molybdopterin-dependent oxidoreductase [Sulfurovum sp.]MCB4778459.1 molybdopterin-dependent oxidoreductase [Sulfurovum sp.]MCB4783795.1 molybdopterin-dependent oxidoreductase [Sulfurovum sp.]
MSECIDTACGLDCYDACRIIVDKEVFPKIRGDKTHPAGNGALCTLLNKYIHEEVRIEKPRVNSKEVSMKEALDAVAKALNIPEKLLWRGSGNLGVMQEVTNLLMEKIGGTLTSGSLCDAAGHAGIEAGRGVNRTLPLEQIAKAETVVIWGRNITVTNAHLAPFLEKKKIIVIDPIKTPIAKRADLHMQIEPRTDYYVAILLARFIFMEDGQDDTWLEEFAPEFEDFYDYTREHRIKAILEHIGTDLGEMGTVLEYMRGKRTVFLVGVGVQKYTVGSYTLHAIDSLAATLGLFGKEGCGVHYLGDSKLGFKNPFDVKTKCVPKATTPFSEFGTVIVQGGNPAASMPDSNRVIEALKRVKNLIYFGLYENETSALANIVIPAKNFFEKEDIRLSYGHQYIERMRTVSDSKIGISEYDFTKVLLERFGFDNLEGESYYLEKWVEQCEKSDEGYYIAPDCTLCPYEEGFGEEEDDKFEFIDDYDDNFIDTKRFRRYRKQRKNNSNDTTFWLLSPKSAKSLNTQFVRDNRVQLHSQIGYEEGEKVKLTSEYGEQIFIVHINDDIRPNCALVTSNTIGVNFLTPSILSDEGKNACYQEIKVSIEKINA